MNNIKKWFFGRTPVTYFSGNRKLKQAVERGNQVFLIYIDVVRSQEIENRHGEKIISNIFTEVMESIEKNTVVHFKNMDILGIRHLWGDDFIVCFTPHENNSQLGPADIEKKLYSFRDGLEQDCYTRLDKLLDSPMKFHIGYAFMEGKRDNLEKQMYVAIKQAVKLAKESNFLKISKYAHEFEEILKERNISIVYQPIISLKNGEVYGWESLARGPHNTYFSSPDRLFSFAEEVGKLYQLERLCREQSILTSQNKIPTGKKLFLNLNPKVIDDPDFVRGQTAALLKEHGLLPSEVVFEITEHHAIKDYKHFKKVLEYYRSQGFLIAIDDTGAGHSNLQSVVELSPDFIKLDHSLISGIDRNRMKQAVIESFVTLSRKINCQIVAEGIERYEELHTLIHLGVDLGQGYYISRPQHEFVLPPEQVVNEIRRKVTTTKQISESTITVGDIVQPEVMVDKERKSREIQLLFQENPRLSSVIVIHEGKPAGLVMRQHFLQFLSTQYGVPLFYDRPITEIMDKTPLILNHDDSIDSAGQLAMNRSDLKLYDDIIVMNRGKIHGIVTVRNLIENIMRSKIEMARFANPLTGLPGNIKIEHELKKRLQNRETFAAIYCDLNQFKHFNDRFGFELGDRIILFTARFLQIMLTKFGSAEDFLGHIGGDDFLILTSPQRVHLFGGKVIRYFRMAMAILRKHTGVYVSLSMASILCNRDWFENHIQISEFLAEVKKKAKSQQDSAFIFVNHQPGTDIEAGN